jgi:hypothetical protein
VTATNVPSTLPTETYYIADPTKSYTFAAFTSDVIYCGVWLYTALNTDGTALISSITMTSATRQFTVYSTTVAEVGTYDIIVTGDYAGYSTSTFTYTLYIKCLIRTLTHIAVAD